MEEFDKVYCDVIAGQLIYFFDIEDLAARNLLDRIINDEKISHYVRILDYMRSKLERIGLSQSDRFYYELYLLGVEAGEEIMKINWLLEEYQIEAFNLLRDSEPSNDRPILGFMPLKVVPNSYYSVNSFLKRKSQQSFEFTSWHRENVEQMGFQHLTNDIEFASITIIDSGIDASDGLEVVLEKNFLSENTNRKPSDECGHGTAIASMINDICPGIPIISYKVANKHGKATEWDLAASLVANNPSSIYNISLSYGLADLNCGTCGRQSASSRSYVLEFLIGHNFSENKIIVVSAGNYKRDRLDYPARFGKTIGVTSATSTNQLNDYSNFGIIDHAKETHNFVIGALGGNKQEPIFNKYKKVKKAWGTSFSAAYVTSMVAHLRSRFPTANNQLFIEKFMAICADNNFQGYDPNLFGNGILNINPDTLNALDEAL